MRQDVNRTQLAGIFVFDMRAVRPSPLHTRKAWIPGAYANIRNCKRGQNSRRLYGGSCRDSLVFTLHCGRVKRSTLRVPFTPSNI